MSSENPLTNIRQAIQLLKNAYELAQIEGKKHLAEIECNKAIGFVKESLLCLNRTQVEIDEKKVDF